MARKRFKFDARVSTDSPAAIRLELEKLFTKGGVTAGETADEFLVKGEMEGESAKELNRTILSALRKVEKKTRLRAEWTHDELTERFFDYVPKGTYKARV
jgi:hypothetical protein